MLVPVRYFIYDYDESIKDYDIIEVSESDFIDFEGSIDYERHTVRENGVSQICLTKGMPRG
jgi:hypothetical protein